MITSVHDEVPASPAGSVTGASIAAPAPAPAPDPDPDPAPALPPFDPAQESPSGDRTPQEERRARICLYLARRVRRDGSGKLERGALRDAASEFGGSLHVVRAVWDRNMNAILEPDRYALDVARRKGCGRPSKMTCAQVRAAVGRVPCRYRHSLRTLAE